MKFDQMCKYVISEKYDGKFIAISPMASKIVVPPEAIAKLARKPQVNIKELGPEFVKKLVIDLMSDLPLRDEIIRDDPYTQFSKDDVIERIARKVSIAFEVNSNKAKQAGLQIFRRLMENGIIETISYKETKKIEKEDEINTIEDADWLGGAGLGGGQSISLPGIGSQPSDDWN